MLRNRMSGLILLLASAVVSVAFANRVTAADFEFRQGDRICYIGNTLADRLQHDGWLETLIQATHPELEISVRNLGFPGDEVKTRPRSANFGSPDEWLTKTGSDVVFSFFGYNEALRGAEGLKEFETQVADMIENMRAQHYNGESAPRLVLFSPIAHENLNIPYLPDGSENNKKLEMYTEAMRQVCGRQDVRFVDLFHPTKRLFDESQAPLTMNGVHLLENGNKSLAEIIMRELFPGQVEKAIRDGVPIERIRQAVIERNYYWFSRYRVVDGYNVFGGRSTLAWHGQSNYDVMQREMQIFDVMTANRDKRVWAVARGGDLKVVDDNIPPLLPVKTNKPGPLPDEAFPYLSGEEAIEKMSLAEGLQVNLFASEEMFPELVNPVQMAIDTDSRLFVSVWPSYPHWNPTEPRRDRIICLPDDDGDGVADKCIVFADELNSITGLEFWGGGVLVAAPPEIWFLRDTDGDDVADYKLRMLQGLSSADTHHSANALVVGPDGGLYFSRGIFNVANMETPTQTYRSTQSGVHRFDPRTFEMSFQFPIGPNPHGDVIDQWGYQFANDGTGGTGSYVNIGKGVGNKQWFQKRVRPVAATGILSSSHFPDENQGNFLICNTIGVLGVLQHDVKYDGADITAVEIEPILLSTDQNFRPTDVEIGGDGALYVSDWSNVLIGHMQHNMRDPNRDHEHGRVYRVTHRERPLLQPVKMKGQPITDVLGNFYAKENSTRYRARLELSGRKTSDVTQAVSRWAAKLDPSQPEDGQALLECLWVFEEHRVPNRELLVRVLEVAEPRVRAAAIRTLGHWGPKIQDWEPILVAAAQDQSALVRAEAVKSAVSFTGLTAAEVIFEVANQPTDTELETVIRYARQQINVDQVVQDALGSGRELSAAAQLYVLRNANVDDLLKMERTEAVYLAILERDNASPSQLENALSGLAQLTGGDMLDLLLKLIEDQDGKEKSENLAALASVLAAQPADRLRGIQKQLQAFAASAKTSAARQLGYAAWIVAENSAKNAFAAASKDKGSLRDVLEAIALIPDGRQPNDTYERVRSLIFDLPGNLKRDESHSALEQPGIFVDFYARRPGNAEMKTFAQATPTASGVVPGITIDVPQRTTRDGFGLRFTGTILVEKSGRYSFFTNSDDGSRLYIDGQEVVNNDGDHGMSEKRGRINLSTGTHAIVVTYFDSGGGDGLVVSWAGPGFRKQPIPASQLFVAGADTIHDVAIRAVSALTGHDEQKFQDLSQAIRQSSHPLSAVRAMLETSPTNWTESELRPTAEKLAAYVSEIPAASRTGQAALDAMRLTDLLASKLPADEAQRFQSRLADLAVNVIRLGTVTERMIYDKERLAVQAGKPVEFVFTNTDNMPHNFAIVQPGSLEEVGLLAEATARDADAMARHYIPTSDKILLASRLLQPTESQALTFHAPTEPGIYPYVCTYPGHWRRMHGALYVVKDLKQYLVDPAKYLAANPLPLRDELLKFTRNTEWTYDELAEPVKMLAGDHIHESRQYDVAKSIFTAATCVACHKFNGEGREFGPDLANLDAKKKNPDHILRSILDPSTEIDEKYQNYAFELVSGKTVTGLVVNETPDEVFVVEDPVLKPEPTVLKRSQIDDRAKLPTSTMPKGLLSKLSREEILDLIAYVYSGGDKQHQLFAGSHQHQDH